MVASGILTGYAGSICCSISTGVGQNLRTRWPISPESEAARGEKRLHAQMYGDVPSSVLRSLIVVGSHISPAGASSVSLWLEGVTARAVSSQRVVPRNHRFGFAMFAAIRSQSERILTTRLSDEFHHALQSARVRLRILIGSVD